MQFAGCTVLQFYSFTVASSDRWFFARMCLYLLALVNSWGTPKNYKTTQNYGSFPYSSFFNRHPYVASLSIFKIKG